MRAGWASDLRLDCGHVRVSQLPAIPPAHNTEHAGAGKDADARIGEKAAGDSEMIVSPAVDEDHIGNRQVCRGYEHREERGGQGIVRADDVKGDGVGA